MNAPFFMSRFNFSRKDRLKSKKVIDSIFKESASVHVFPFLMRWLIVDKLEGMPRLQFGVSVSKRNFKRAVDRNKIKRHIREAYRLNKNDFNLDSLEKDKMLAVFVIYIGKPDTPLVNFGKAMKKVIKKWNETTKRNLQ